MSIGPSVVIAVWICIAFILGRLLARFVPRIAARVVALVLALPLAVYVLREQIPWQAAGIPIALVLGVFTYGHRKIAPGVFDPPE